MESQQCRKRVSVDFAVHCHWNGVDEDELSRQHVDGKTFRECVSKRVSRLKVRSATRLRATDNKGGKRLRAAILDHRKNDGLSHFRKLPKIFFNVAKLDAVAIKFDLT